ncbi:uncharacterized protein LOC110345933 [Heterocephalus glaber]|uniref:Uncharacterized protein LOC110345933 n=1 Tax=Heterocephalus glaber TaxID=10181 RepID=A0AAX6RWS9_HETGA|nr:uncharacterized protein LOC110345933 [Heterocephalus glaber]
MRSRGASEKTKPLGLGPFSVPLAESNTHAPSLPPGPGSGAHLLRDSPPPATGSRPIGTVHLSSTHRALAQRWTKEASMSPGAHGDPAESPGHARNTRPCSPPRQLLLASTPQTSATSSKTPPLPPLPQAVLGASVFPCVQDAPGSEASTTRNEQHPDYTTVTRDFVQVGKLRPREAKHRNRDSTSTSTRVQALDMWDKNSPSRASQGDGPDSSARALVATGISSCPAGLKRSQRCSCEGRPRVTRGRQSRNSGHSYFWRPRRESGGGGRASQERGGWGPRRGAQGLVSSVGMESRVQNPEPLWAPEEEPGRDAVPNRRQDARTDWPGPGAKPS